MVVDLTLHIDSARCKWSEINLKQSLVEYVVKRSK